MLIILLIKNIILFKKITIFEFNKKEKKMKKMILSIFAMLAFAISAKSQTVTSTTVETIVKLDSIVSIEPCLFEMNLVVNKNSNVTAASIRFYINDNPTLTGAEILGFYTTTSSTKYIPIERRFWYKNNTLNGFSKTTSFMYDFVPNTQPYSTTTVDLNCKKYIIITIQPTSNTTEIFSFDSYSFRKI